MPLIVRLAFTMLFAGILPGCMIVDVGVTNPLPDVSTVAVVPFFNQSEERMVNGRLLATQYASELQKTPGLEVIPVGVVETTMRQYGLQDIAGPADAARLALLLKADAVVIGTVTEYSPYYPPRLGLSVAWYSPFHQRFEPGIPLDSKARKRVHDNLKARRKAEARQRREERRHRKEWKQAGTVVTLPPGTVIEPSGPAVPVVPGTGSSGVPRAPGSEASDPPATPDSRFRPPIVIRGQSPSSGPPLRPAAPAAGPLHIRPLMTYTKVFDASDAATTAAFRDFLELRGDALEAKWTARLQWADDFSRFACHSMIVEMFMLHGGEGRRRVILKWRNHK